jgi:hypothetical protein
MNWTDDELVMGGKEARRGPLCVNRPNLNRRGGTEDETWQRSKFEQGTLLKLFVQVPHV